MESRDQIEKLLRNHLQPPHLPEPDATWQRLQPSLQNRARHTWLGGRALRVGLGVIVAILASVSIGLASSPTLFHHVASLVGFASANNHITALQPAPPFTVLQPSILPAGTRLVAQAYQPGPLSDGKSSPSGIGSPLVRPAVVGASAQRVDAPELDRGLLEAARRQAQDLLGSAQEATLVLVYANTDGQWFAVVERSASGKALPSGAPVTVDRSEAAITTDGGETIVSWISRGTFLQVHTTAGNNEATAFANRLRPTTVDSAASTAAEQLSAIPSPVPLARRVVAVETPSAESTDRASQCGAWSDGNPSTPTNHDVEQAICMARATVGITKSGSYGLSRYSWHEAAARLGVAPGVGPSNDPTVWLAEVYDRSEKHGWVVVLDAKTGHPYIVVRLKSRVVTQSRAPSQP